MAGYDQYINAMQQQSEANNVFNAQQAQINRDFQLEMSNTAHQREVKDLIAAGLNPILSANAGASTASGSTATADTSSAQGFANLANTGMNNITQLALAEINKAAQLQAAQISANAVMRAAELGYAGSVYSADSARHSKVSGVGYDILNGLYKGVSSARGYSHDYIDQFYSDVLGPGLVSAVDKARSLSPGLVAALAGGVSAKLTSRH